MICRIHSNSCVIGNGIIPYDHIRRVEPSHGDPIGITVVNVIGGDSKIHQVIGGDSKIHQIDEAFHEYTVMTGAGLGCVNVFYSIVCYFNSYDAAVPRSESAATVAVHHIIGQNAIS